MSRNISKKMVYTVAGLLLAGVIVYGIGYYLVVSPIKTELDSANQEVDLYEKQFAKLTAEDGKSEQNGTPEVFQKLPSEKTVDSFLKQVEAKAKGAGISIASIHAAENQQAQDDESSPDQLQQAGYILEGTAETLEKAETFMSNISNSKRFVVVDTITLEQASAAAEFSLHLSIFYTAR